MTDKVQSTTEDQLTAKVQSTGKGGSKPGGDDVPTSDVHSSQSELGELLQNLPVLTSEDQDTDRNPEICSIQSQESSSNVEVPQLFMCGEILSVDEDSRQQTEYLPSPSHVQGTPY